MLVEEGELVGVSEDSGLACIDRLLVVRDRHGELHLMKLGASQVDVSKGHSLTRGFQVHVGWRLAFLLFGSAVDLRSQVMKSERVSVRDLSEQIGGSIETLLAAPTIFESIREEMSRPVTASATTPFRKDSDLCRL